jgi:hypothetical protein
MYDEFVANMRCLHCGSEASERTPMQTHIRGGGADGSELPVGYCFKPVDLTTSHLLGTGYMLIKEPVDAESLCLLDVWICYACETEQWGRVAVAKRCIEQISAVTLTRTVLESANFISEMNAELLAARLLDIHVAEINQHPLPIVEILRRHLP